MSEYPAESNMGGGPSGPGRYSVLHSGEIRANRDRSGSFDYVSTIGKTLAHMGAAKGRRPANGAAMRAIPPRTAFSLAYSTSINKAMSAPNPDVPLAKALAYLEGVQAFKEVLAYFKAKKINTRFLRMSEEDLRLPEPPPGADMARAQNGTGPRIPGGSNAVLSGTVANTMGNGILPNAVQASGLNLNGSVTQKSTQTSEKRPYESADGQTYHLPAGANASTILIHCMAEIAKGGNPLPILVAAKLELSEQGRDGATIFNYADYKVALPSPDDAEGASFG